MRKLKSKPTVAAFLATVREPSRRAYANDLGAWASAFGEEDVEGIARRLLPLRRAEAHDAVFSAEAPWRGAHSPATVNRRRAVLRALSRFMCRGGLTEWTLDLPELPRAHREPKAVPESQFVAALRELRRRTDAKGRRDLAIVLLLGAGVTAAEITRLLVSHVDRDGNLFVPTRGRSKLRPLEADRETRAALLAWIAARGSPPTTALFTNLSRAHDARGLSYTGVLDVVSLLGKACDFELSPLLLRRMNTVRAARRRQDALKPLPRPIR